MFYDVAQNTDQWFEMRAGKVSGSSIAKVMANYGKAFGDPAKKLAVEIAVHRETGNYFSDNYSNSHMDRGHEQEPIARALYEDKYFVDVSNGGFFDNGVTGCSPDGLVYKDGVIEIKSVMPHVHDKTIQRGDVDPAYRWQCAFNLKQTGREWIDYVSYCEQYPEVTQLFVKRRDKESFADEFEMMEARLEQFEQLVSEAECRVTPTKQAA